MQLSLVGSCADYLEVRDTCHCLMQPCGELHSQVRLWPGLAVARSCLLHMRVE